jgi:hypothetical protein
MIPALISELARIKGAKFASFTYRSKESNELARYTIMLGVDLRAVYEKDRALLADLLPTLDGLSRDAGAALLASIEESLSKGLGNNSAYTHGAEQGDTYVHLEGVPGVSVNKNDGVLHVKGMLVNKVTLEEGVFKQVNSRPLTLAKRELEKQLRRSKIRQFALTNVASARINGETLELV